MPNSSIWPIDKTLSDATTPGLGRPGSDGKESVLRIPQSSSITWASPSDCLMSFPEHSLDESYPSADALLVYSTTPADSAYLRKCHNFYVNYLIDYGKSNIIIHYFQVNKQLSW